MHTMIQRRLVVDEVCQAEIVFKLDMNSNLIRARPNRAHHDLEVMPNGDIYELTFVVLPRDFRMAIR